MNKYIINTEKLEKNLGFKINKNIICLGLDIATKTGVAIVKTDPKKTKIISNIIRIPSIPRKIKNEMEKSEKYEQAMYNLVNIVRDFKKRLNVPSKKSLLVIEQSYLGINPETYGYLRCIQGIYYSELFDFFPTKKIWLATTARKIVGFRSRLPRKSTTYQRKKEIMKWVSNIIEKPVKDDNCADALILAFAGIKL